ncbi:MAG: hypothetical protein FWE54_06300 [Methanimicrococcus sp.]|nr:hypothetical protein [Methanimicrococcus sp.]
MTKQKETGYIILGSVLLSLILFVWYALAAPLTGLNFSNDIVQLAAVTLGIVLCIAAYGLSKPEF